MILRQVHASGMAADYIERICWGAHPQGLVLRALTYAWLRFYDTSNSTQGNPFYRLFSATWSCCLKNSSQRWEACFESLNLPTILVAGAASEHAAAGSLVEPMLHHQERQNNSQ